MATRPFWTKWIAGEAVEIRFERADGLRWDFDDDSWKATPTTATAATSEDANMGDTTMSLYKHLQDLALMNNTATPMDIIYQFLVDDITIAEGDAIIMSGDLATEDSAEIAALGAGAGIYGTTWTCATSAGDVISGVNVAFYGTGGNLVASGATLANGKASMNLNADTYLRRAVAPGRFTFPEATITITGNTTGTITGSPVDAGTGSYYTLVVNEGHLKNFDELTGTATSGIIQADLTIAERFAFDVTNAAFASQFNVASWVANTPPLVARINDLLGSGKLISMKYSREGRGGAEYAKTLREEAWTYINAVRERKLDLLDVNGNRID